MATIWLEAFRRSSDSSLVERVERLRARLLVIGFYIQLRVEEGEGQVRSSDIRVYVCGSRCACWENKRYILHVIILEANIFLSFSGISARDARVAVEVVYHHTFLVFGQRSVQRIMDGPVSVKTSFRTVQNWVAYSLSVHQKTSVYLSGAVFHQRRLLYHIHLLDLLKPQRRLVGYSSCGRLNR